MGYADRQQRNRDLSAKNFVKRYNPAADAMAALDEIEDEVYKRERDTKGDERLARLDSASERRLDLAEQRAAAQERRAIAQEERAADEDASQASARDAANKRAQAEADRKGQEAKRKDAFAAANAAMAGGLSQAELEQRAAEVGMDPNAFLAAVDQIEQDRQKAEAEEQAKAAAMQAKTDEDIAQAKKAARGSGPASPPAPDSPADIKARTAKARLAALEEKAKPSDPFAPSKETRTKLQKDRVDLQKAASAAQAIRALVAKYPDLESYVGPLDAVAGWLGRKTGMGSTKSAEIASTLKRAFDAYRVAVTGAAASNAEMSSLMDTVPSSTDSVDQIIGKLDAGDNLLNPALADIDAVLGKGDIRAVGEAPPVAPASKKDEEEADALFAD